MLKKLFFTLLLALTIPYTICLANLTQDDFTINGVNLITSSYDDVITTLGEPAKKTVDQQGEPALTYLTYKGLRVWTVNNSGQVAYILADGRDYETHRGIKIGATPYKVTKEYGDPLKENIRNHVYYVYKLNPTSGHRLYFDMTEGYVSRMIFTSLPTSP